MSTTEKGIRNIETMQNAMWITTIVLLLGNLGFLVLILKRLAARDKTQEKLPEELSSKIPQLFGEYFNTINQHLVDVQQGVEEMRDVASMVQAFQNLLRNPNTKGIWGEVQLKAILEQVLTPDQYGTNVRIKENSRVEFAIRLPGSDNQPDSCIWLPIDSKFPTADYQQLVEAEDQETKKRATTAFIGTVESEAKKIRDRYIVPPETTDFAIMFVPAESLYAEILREPGQLVKLQKEYRIVVAGPTTLTALLNSLRLGFQTLAVQKHSSEVWKLLAAVKTEFDRFGEVITRLNRNLTTASNTVKQTGVRTRAMARKLREVEKLTSEESARIFGFAPDEQIGNEDNLDDQ